MYGIYLRSGLLSSLGILTLLFMFVPYNEPEPYDLKHDIVTMVEAITAQIDRIDEPPIMERPRVAVEAPSEVAADSVALTIATTEFREDLIRTTPTGPDIEIVPYYKITVKPRYPDIVRRAGIEGQVVVKALVDIDGSIIDVQILSSSGNQMLDEEAMAAARKWKFSPAKQRDKFVRVYVSIPVNFKLVDAG
jgi:protein TonB